MTNTPTQPPSIPWLPPVDLSLTCVLPTFPVDVLPAWIRDYVEATATAVQVAVDLPAMLALTVVSAATGGRVTVGFAGRVEPTNLYTVGSLPPGQGKSPVFSMIAAPLVEAEKQLRLLARDDISRAACEKDLAERRARQAEAVAVSGADGDDAGELRTAAIEARLAAERLRVPVAPRLFVDDVTPEQLATVLAEQKGRLGLFSDEGGVFKMMQGRYSARSNLEVYLKGHSGSNLPLRVDRRARQEEVVRPALTMGLTVQPDVIAELGRNREMLGRGLLARFLPYIPAETLGSRLPLAPQPSEEVRAIYQHTMCGLICALACAYPEAEDSTHIELSEQAAQVWKQLFERVELQLAEHGPLRHMADWAAKLAGQVLRIAAVLHVAEHGVAVASHESACGPVTFPATLSESTMLKAVAVAEYLIPHAQATYDQLGSSTSRGLAELVMAWLKANVRPGWKGPVTIKRRDIHQRMRSTFVRAADLDPVLKLLESRDILRRVEDHLGRPGRPSTVYEVNPYLFRPSKGVRIDEAA